jgi:hypothetical protein
MVGGRVLETVVVEVDGKPRVWVSVAVGQARTETGVWLAGTFAARSVSEGDELRWQGEWAYWTPRSRAFHAKQLLRIGSSGAPRPTAAVITTGEGEDDGN